MPCSSAHAAMFLSRDARGFGVRDRIVLIRSRRRKGRCLGRGHDPLYTDCHCCAETCAGIASFCIVAASGICATLPKRRGAIRGGKTIAARCLPSSAPFREDGRRASHRGAGVGGSLFAMAGAAFPVLGPSPLSSAASAAAAAALPHPGTAAGATKDMAGSCQTTAQAPVRQNKRRSRGHARGTGGEVAAPLRSWRCYAASAVSTSCFVAPSSIQPPPKVCVCVCSCAFTRSTGASVAPPLSSPLPYAWLLISPPRTLRGVAWRLGSKVG